MCHKLNQMVAKADSTACTVSDSLSYGKMGYFPLFIRETIAKNLFLISLFLLRAFSPV